MLIQYLLLEHPNEARSMWQAMGDRTSMLATLAEDSYEFTRLIPRPRSDLMDVVLRGDEEAMRNPVLNYTVELAHSLWPNCSVLPTSVCCSCSIGQNGPQADTDVQ